MEDCIFCKIINGTIPSRKVYEDENVLAFLDISQVTPGHTLLVPKKHVKDIYSFDENLTESFFKPVPRLSKAVKGFSNARGLNLVMNNGEAADQSVFHSHLHLIPRYSESEDFQIKWVNHSDRYSDAEMDDMTKAIRAEMEEQ